MILPSREQLWGKHAERTLLGNLTEESSPEACAFTTESINAIHTSPPIQAGVAQTLVYIFCTVDARPT